MTLIPGTAKWMGGQEFLGGFSPAVVPGILLWVEDKATIDGSNNVVQFTDRSGNGNHLGDPDALVSDPFGVNVSAPTWVASDAEFNNHPVISGDGVDQCLIAQLSGVKTNEPAASVAGAGHSYFFMGVAKAADTSTSTLWSIGKEDDGNVNAYARQQSDQYCMFREPNSVGDTLRCSNFGPGPADTAKHLHVMWFDGSSNEMHWEVDGVEVLNDTSGGDNGGPFDVNRLMLMAWFQGGTPGEFWAGKIASLAMFDQIPVAADKSALEQRLADKYGIVL